MYGSVPPSELARREVVPNSSGSFGLIIFFFTGVGTRPHAHCPPDPCLPTRTLRFFLISLIGPIGPIEKSRSPKARIPSTYAKESLQIRSPGGKNYRPVTKPPLSLLAQDVGYTVMCRQRRWRSMSGTPYLLRDEGVFSSMRDEGRLFCGDNRHELPKEMRASLRISQRKRKGVSP